MISNVSFTGREGMLNQAVRSANTSGASYISPSKVYSAAEKALSSLVNRNVLSLSTKSENAAASYAISHGTPKSAIVGINVDTIV